jgi:hypothetical protein
MVPPAPPRLSMTNCWPHVSLSFWNRMRLTVSAPPAGGYGTITRTGRAGQAACAEAVPVRAAGADAATAAAESISNCRRVGFDSPMTSSLYCGRRAGRSLFRLPAAVYTGGTRLCMVRRARNEPLRSGRTS